MTVLILCRVEAHERSHGHPIGGGSMRGERTLSPGPRRRFVSASRSFLPSYKHKYLFFLRHFSSLSSPHTTHFLSFERLFLHHHHIPSFVTIALAHQSTTIL